MRRTLTIAFALALSAAFATAAFGGECGESDRNTLKKLDQDWGNYNQQQDKAALDAILADGYAAFNISGSSDKASALAALDTPPPANPPGFFSDHYIISCTGDTAVMTHRNEITTPDGEFFSRSVHVFQRSGGKWKVIASVNHPMDEAGALIYLNYSGLEAFRHRDIEWFDKHMDAGYFYAAPDGTLKSRSESLDGIKNDPNKYEMIEMDQVSAMVDGDMAVVTGIVRMKGQTPDRTTFEAKTRFTRTFKKKGGRWFAVSTHSTMIEGN